MNLRAGKYRHLGNAHKNACYQNIHIEFSRADFKNWCKERWNEIATLDRPSIDRLDASKNYSLDNLRVVELRENIARKGIGFTDRYGVKRGVREIAGRFYSRIYFKGKQYSLGGFASKEEAEEAYRLAFVKFHNKEPW